MPRPALKTATVTTAPISDLQAATPAQIDEQLARLNEQAYRIQSERHVIGKRVQSEQARKERLEPRQQWYRWDEQHLAQLQERLDSLRTTRRALLAEAAPYEDEFSRRGGWARYFKVTNGNGHVHRGTNCSTCHITTQFAWLVELASKDEAAMVAQFGHVACTVCFPSAPVEEMRRAYEAALYCSGSGKAPKSSYRAGRGRRGACPECGKNASLTSYETLPKHKKAAS